MENHQLIFLSQQVVYYLFSYTHDGLWMIKPIFYTVCLGLCYLSITSCATLSKQECLQGNWQAIGYKDGTAGRYPTYISNHQKACAKANIIANQPLWEQGRKQGLKQYCTQPNAFQLGTRGINLNKVCPANVTAKLQSINQTGLNQFKIANTIKKDEQKIKDYQSQLKKLKEGDMLNFKTEKEARIYMLSIADKINNLEQQVNQNTAALTKLQLANVY